MKCGQSGAIFIEVGLHTLPKSSTAGRDYLSIN